MTLKERTAHFAQWRRRAMRKSRRNIMDRRWN